MYREFKHWISATERGCRFLNNLDTVWQMTGVKSTSICLVGPPNPFRVASSAQTFFSLDRVSTMQATSFGFVFLNFLIEYSAIIMCYKVNVQAVQSLTDVLTVVQYFRSTLQELWKAIYKVILLCDFIVNSVLETPNSSKLYILELVHNFNKFL